MFQTSHAYSADHFLQGMKAFFLSQQDQTALSFSYFELVSKNFQEQLTELRC